MDADSRTGGFSPMEEGEGLLASGSRLQARDSPDGLDRLSRTHPVRPANFAPPGAVAAKSAGLRVICLFFDYPTFGRC